VINYYGFIGKFNAQAGKRDELLGILLNAAEALGSNEDCLLYVLNTSEQEPNAIWANEIWTSKAAHDASVEPEEVKALIRQAMPLIAGAPEGTELTVMGGKGI
jgi:quinol monooxygenase YgiN